MSTRWDVRVSDEIDEWMTQLREDLGGARINAVLQLIRMRLPNAAALVDRGEQARRPESTPSRTVPDYSRTLTDSPGLHPDCTRTVPVPDTHGESRTTPGDLTESPGVVPDSPGDLTDCPGVAHNRNASARAGALPPSLPPSKNYVEGEERQASGARAYEPPPPPPSYVDESEPPGAGLEAVDWIKGQWNQRARRNPALVAARIVHESAVLEAWRAHPDRESWAQALDHIAAKPAEWLTHYRLTTLAGAVRISERFKLPKIFAALNGEYEERFEGSARASPSSRPNVTRMIPPGRKPLFEAANDEPGQTYEIPHVEWR